MPSPICTESRPRLRRAVKLAVVVQRYGHAVNGGAELHARYIARTSRAPRRSRGSDHVRHRLRDMAQRARAGARAGERRVGSAIPGETRARSRVFGRRRSACSNSCTRSATNSTGSTPRGRPARRSSITSPSMPLSTTSVCSSAIATTTRFMVRAPPWRGRFWCRRPSATPPSACRFSAAVPERARGHVQLAGRAGDDPRRVRQRDVPGVVVGVGSDVPQIHSRRASGRSTTSAARLLFTSAVSTRTKAAKSCSSSLTVISRIRTAGCRWYSSGNSLAADSGTSADPSPRFSGR